MSTNLKSNQNKIAIRPIGECKDFEPIILIKDECNVGEDHHSLIHAKMLVNYLAIFSTTNLTKWRVDSRNAC